MVKSLRKPAAPTGSVLEALIGGQFEEGLRRHAALPEPSAADATWAAQCLVLLGRRQEGLALMLRARATGHEDAGALAAVIYRFDGHLARTAELLDGLDHAVLTGFGRAVDARERGMLLYLNGRLRDALSLVQQAWEYAVADDVGCAFMPAFSAPLAMVLTALGRDEQAITCVNLALPLASPPQRAPLLWTRAQSAVHLGRFEQATQDLDDLTLNCATKDAKPLLSYHRGMVLQARGLSGEARYCFEQAAQGARETGQPETECYAHLRLCALATAADDLDASRAHLARAGALAEGARTQAFLALRQAAVFVRQHDPRGAELLHVTLEAFEQLGLQREAGLALLNLAEAALRRGRIEEAQRHLTRVADVRHALDSGITLASETRTLPAVFDYLQQHAKAHTAGYLKVLWQDTSELERHLPVQLVIKSLGSYSLTFSGQAVRLNVGVPRTVELLSYLLNAGEATLEQVQTHVFEDNDPETARDYLHVARNALGKAVPQLLIPYDRIRRVYGVQPQGIRLKWDVQDVRTAVRTGGEGGLRRALGSYGGPFLPQTGTSWAGDIRSDLEWSLVRLGLETLEDLQSKGQHRTSVDLARRLLTVQPLDAGIHALLVRGVHLVKGPVAACQEAQHAVETFRRELGHVPDRLRELHQDLQAVR